MRKICIITASDEKAALIKQILGEIGTFDYTTIITRDDLSSVSKENNYDLYIAYADIIATTLKMKECLTKIPADKLIALSPDWMARNKHLDPHHIAFTDGEFLHDPTTQMSLQNLAKSILDPHSAKRVCIAYTNDEANDNMAKIRSELNKLGSCIYTLIETREDVVEVCSKREFELYIMEDVIVSEQVDAITEVVPKEKLMVMGVNGSLSGDLTSQNISYSSTHFIQSATNIIKKILQN